MEALLAKVVDIGNTGCELWLETLIIANKIVWGGKAYGSRRESCTFGIRHAIEVRRFYEVPVGTSQY